MLFTFSRGALLASAVVVAIAGAISGRAGLDPFARPEPSAEPAEIAHAVVVKKMLIRPSPGPPPDPVWVNEVRRVVGEHLGELRGCGSHLFENESFEALARLTIDDGGAVYVELGALDDSRLGNCLASRLRGLRYPAPAQGSAVAEVAIELGHAGEWAEIFDHGPLVLGSLDVSVVQRVIDANRQPIRYCYEVASRNGSAFRAKVAVKFVISAAGTVVGARVAQSTVNDAELETCILSRVKSYQFPKPRGGGVVIVTYPIIFGPAGK